MLAILLIVVTQTLIGEEGRLAVLASVSSVFGSAAADALDNLARAFNGPLLQRVETVDAAGTEFGSEARATGGALIIGGLYAFRAAAEFVRRRRLQ